MALPIDPNQIWRPKNELLAPRYTARILGDHIVNGGFDLKVYLVNVEVKNSLTNITRTYPLFDVEAFEATFEKCEA